MQPATYAALEIFAAIIAVIILVGRLATGRGDRPAEVTLAALIASCPLMLLGDAAAYLLADQNASRAYTVSALLSYLGYFLILALFTYYILFSIRERKYVPLRMGHVCALLAAAGWILWCVSTQRMGVGGGPAGGAGEGTLYLLGRLCAIAIILTDMILILIHRKALGRFGAALFLVYIIIPAASLVTRFFHQGSAYLNLAISLSLTILYIVLSVNQNQLLREQEAELAQNRIAITLSQIQPHFLYNALNTIYYLCGKDPDQAQRAISAFSGYLRTNLDSLTQAETVPFEKELEHTRAYLSLEKMRFEEDLQIEWEIGPKDFRIPAISVQPLVENAVKHGVMRRADGGTVRISTREERGSWVVEVQDDGVGYDIHVMKQDGRSHVGIANVRDRLADLCDGRLEITSEEGVGTTATIRIPKVS